ncbi:MAG: hypothetical protein AB1324_05975, partial [Candidatus Micrarchaeota archaeon]
RAETARRREDDRQAQQERPAQAEQEETSRTAPKSPMSARVWSRVYSDAETILDRFPQLTEEHRTAIHGIVDRGGSSGSRRLVSVNLTSYLRYLSDDLHLITSQQATELYDSFFRTNARSPGLVLMAEQWVREEREQPRALPQPERMAPSPFEPREAPARTERYAYRFTVSGEHGVISTFDITSPRPIESQNDLVSVLRDRPEGLSVTRIARSGRRIELTNSDENLDTLAERLGSIRYDPRYTINITERKGGQA